MLVACSKHTLLLQGLVRLGFRHILQSSRKNRVIGATRRRALGGRQEGPCLRCVCIGGSGVVRESGVGLRRRGRAGGSGLRTPTPPTPASPCHPPTGAGRLGCCLARLVRCPPRVHRLALAHDACPDLRECRHPAGVRVDPRPPCLATRLERGGAALPPCFVHAGKVPPHAGASTMPPVASASSGGGGSAPEAADASTRLVAA